MSIDWDEPIEDVIAELTARNTVNFILTALPIKKEPMECRECGQVFGHSIGHGDMEFECLGCKDVDI